MNNYHDTGLWEKIKDQFNANSEILDWKRFIRLVEQYYNNKKEILIEIDDIEKMNKEIVERQYELEIIHQYIDNMINNSKSAPDNLVGSRLLDKINYIRDNVMSEINHLKSSILEKKHLNYARSQSFWSIFSIVFAGVSFVVTILLSLLF